MSITITPSPTMSYLSMPHKYHNYVELITVNEPADPQVI